MKKKLKKILKKAEKKQILAGKNIPNDRILSLNNTSGFYMGSPMEDSCRNYVGKRSEEDGNVIVVGRNGSGKSYNIAVPNLLTWEKSLVALDIKREFSDWYKECEREGKVDGKSIFFSIGNCEIHYDVYSDLDSKADDFIECVREIADALVPSPIEMKEPYWNDIARQLLTGVIIHCFLKGFDFSQTMIEIHRKSVLELCIEIKNSDHEAAKIFIKDIIGLSDQHRNAIGSTLSNYISAFTDMRVIEAFSTGEDRKTFGWKDIVQSEGESTKVFLHIEEDRLEQWGGLIRVMLTQLIRHLERRPNRNESKGIMPEPFLIMLDEFPRLGKIEVIKSALPTLRSKNVTFALFVQSIAQLDDTYGASARKVLVENCDYKVLLSITEPESQEYFSRMVGTVPSSQTSISKDIDSGTMGYQVHETRERLIFPESFAGNKDIWIMTPGGFVSTLKMPVFELMKHMSKSKLVPAKAYLLAEEIPDNSECEVDSEFREGVQYCDDVIWVKAEVVTIID